MKSPWGLVDTQVLTSVPCSSIFSWARVPFEILFSSLSSFSFLGRAAGVKSENSSLKGSKCWRAPLFLSEGLGCIFRKNIQNCSPMQPRKKQNYHFLILFSEGYLEAYTARQPSLERLRDITLGIGSRKVKNKQLGLNPRTHPTTY